MSVCKNDALLVLVSLLLDILWRNERCRGQLVSRLENCVSLAWLMASNETNNSEHALDGWKPCVCLFLNRHNRTSVDDGSRLG